MDKFNKLSSVEFSDLSHWRDWCSIYIKKILKTNCKWEEGNGVKESNISTLYSNK